MNKLKKPLMIYIGIGAVVILLNVVAWNSTAFCDAYIEYVFPIWVNTYGRLTGLVPFSVGEIMLVLGLVLVELAAVLWTVWVVAAIAGRRAKAGRGQSVAGCGHAGDEQKVGRRGKGHAKRGAATMICRGIRGFYLFFAWTFLIVCLVMTLNCFILYHASTFSEVYFGREYDAEYDLEDLIAVRNMVVEECNRLSLEMERDENGAIVYDKDIGQVAIECMQELGKTYSHLDGFYPQPKPLYTSDFFSQQYMCGYYFPFSMEANYNNVMYIMNKPSTICHELAHLRGYIFEDEANFISFLACIQSEDPVFCYSGYLSVLNYLDNDFYKAVGRDREAYLAQPVISAQVIADNVFVTDEEWDRINSKALIDTETVDEVSDTLVDVTLKANGVVDGMISYNRVVRLLLQWHRAAPCK